MKLAGLGAKSRVGTRKLSNFDWRKSKHFTGSLCIHLRLGCKCCLTNKVIWLAQSV